MISCRCIIVILSEVEVKISIEERTSDGEEEFVDEADS